MKHTITLLSFALLFISCNSVKRNQKLVDRGDYSQAIELAVKKLQKDKDSEKNDAHIALLEKAFKKSADEDTRRLSFLKKENDPASSRDIYNLYRSLQYKQDLLRPLLPLYSETLGRNAKFKMVDYTDELIDAKKAYLAFLYDEAHQYMQRQSIKDYRTAYHIYCDIEELQSNYRDVAVLKDDALFYGTDFVYVTLNNRSGQLMPHRLEQELLDFNTYGLDDFWTQYHSNRDRDIDYNFGIALNFAEIAIAPERISERQERRTKRIKDGVVYIRDRGGNIVRDSLGNALTEDTYITVVGTITITEQYKAVFVGGDVIYRDLIARRDIERHPLSSEFVFDNVFATYRGDKRALNAEDEVLLRNKFVYFPSNADMVLDAGEDIKGRLKDILQNNSFRE